MTDWHAVLRAVAPHGRGDILSGFAEALPGLCEENDLTTAQRQAHFLAQCAHESDGFHTTQEYASGAAYEGRHDLGNTQPGDGKRFKGRGLIQLTGRAGYAKYGTALNVDLVGDPEQAAAFPYAADTAGLFWKAHGLNRLADADDIVSITRRVNGGLNGLASRKAYLAAAKRVLGPAKAAGPYGGLARVGFLSTDDEGKPASESSLTEGEMKQVQTRLASLGYFAGTIDGRAGGETNGAIAAFKTDHNLPPDAVLDQATLSALGSDLAHPRPIAAARANATLDDLRDDGSETIKAADDAESGLSVKAGAGALGVGVISEGVGQVKSLKDTLSDLVGGDLVSFVAAHGLLIAVGIAAAVAWYERGVIRKALDRVRQARLDDHRSFKNRGR